MKKNLKYILFGTGVFFKTFFYWPKANCPTIENLEKQEIKYDGCDTINLKRNYYIYDL